MSKPNHVKIPFTADYYLNLDSNGIWNGIYRESTGKYLVPIGIDVANDRDLFLATHPDQVDQKFVRYYSGKNVVYVTNKTFNRMKAELLANKG